MDAEVLTKKTNETHGINVCLYDAYGNPIASFNGAILVTVGDLGKYEMSDFDDQSAVKYYGYLTATGGWFIRKEDWNIGTRRFFAGASGYAAAWNGRAALAYDYFDAIF